MGSDWIDVPGVRLHHGVVTAIRESAGSEPGGVLLGWFDADLRRFEITGVVPAARSEWSEAGSKTGMYRVHRRSGLQTNDDDADLVSALFPSGPSVLLLVKALSAREWVAACFLCADGMILAPGTSGNEFRFEAPVAELEGTVIPRRRRGGRWLIPSAIAAGLAAAAWLHYAPAGPEESPVAEGAAARESINSASETAPPEPLTEHAASASGKASHLWPRPTAKHTRQTR
ncbi:MAG: hypothetical protein ABUS51_08550 [Acidobacteriota bacterium]